MVGLRSELEAAERDLADFERRVVLISADRHRAREMAAIFESEGWLAEALLCLELAGDTEAALLLQAGMTTPPQRRSKRSLSPIVIPDAGPYAFIEELALVLRSSGDAAAAEFFARSIAVALAGEEASALPAETLVQSAAKLEAAHGPLANLRVEIAAALLCLGEDVAGYQILHLEAARANASHRCRKLLANLLEAQGRTVEARALWEVIALEKMDYPGVRVALDRLGEGGPQRARYRSRSTGETARVVRAYDEVLGRDVALKRLRPDAFESMHRVLDVCEHVAHPGVLMCLDVDPTIPALVFELLEGSLDCLPSAQQHARAALSWAPLFGALAALHESGLVHVSLLPEHILFASQRGLVLGGLSHVRALPAVATENVADLAALMCAHAELQGLDSLASLLQACQAPDPAARPAARSVARALGT